MVVVDVAEVVVVEEEEKEEEVEEDEGSVETAGERAPELVERGVRPEAGGTGTERMVLEDGFARQAG